MKNLTYLDLRSNQITYYSHLQALKNLIYLDLNSNQITDVLVLKGLKNLKILDLMNNRISQLPVELTQMEMNIKWEYDFRFGIFFAGNPLESPPIEIVKQGKEAFLNYFKEIEKESVRLLESKLLIVGNGEVGKTTLMKKLKDNNFKVEIGKEELTHGINIVPWEIQCRFEADKPENVKISFWDFGGQEIYHATHQFFLTKRSLYLFVWEPRKDEEAQGFDYWFDIIRLLSDNSPVIVVMNKSDVRLKRLDEADIEAKYKNIISFQQVSCVSGKGIPELTEQIRKTLSAMNHLHDRLPKVWLQIKNDLREMAKQKKYISRTDYIEICKTYGLNEARAEFLSGYLHDLGVILYYRHDLLLENTVILDPEWATKAFYTLIDAGGIQENKGRFVFDDLKSYWDLEKYPREKHAQLIRLMEKFELCFNILETENHIIPELLPVDRLAIIFGKYQKDNSLQFEYHYDFMPKGIVSRFISRIYYLIRDDHFWKNGVEMKFEDSNALVVSERLNRKMKISVTGSSKSELLAIIRNEFEYIHKTLNLHKDENYHEMIPCTCSKCLDVEKPYLHKYDVLKMFTSKGKSTIECQISAEEVSIEKLIKGFEWDIPRKDLLKTLITIATQLQGISRTMKPDEDSRNGFIALLLSIYGFNAKDQARWGSSATGKSPGRIDIKIENSEGGPEAMLEAFNLETFNSNNINSHLKKLFGYDPSGLERNFIVVYAEANDFSGLWKKYLNHIPNIDFKYRLSEEVQEKELPLTDIKLARTRHLREKKITEVYHLFINMKH
ncbi:MAG: GTP-binding protein [Candidatus Aminicenantes bacterium]|nr:GTP-binding protein [Candidatus Aminicenantes bacterium]